LGSNDKYEGEYEYEFPEDDGEDIVKSDSMIIKA